MISSYCRPNNRPPELDPSEPVGKVSFAKPEHASPRSCADAGIFLSMFDATEKEADASKYEGMQEETAAEVAMLLTAVADIASKEIKDDPPIITALADAFPRFPDLSSTLSDEGDAGIAPHNENEESMDYDMEEREPEGEEGSVPALMHFDHKSKKMRSVSVDLPKQEPLGPPPSPPHEDEAIPTLLQWRNLRGESTSPPHQHGIFSTPPPSPSVSKKHRVTMMPHSEHRRSSASAKAHQGRPRAVSLAEGAMIEQVPVLDLTAPDSDANEKPKTLILRKKFSWKNYPELEEFLIANREEYLRHSTLNYTMQQKKYNNCLTERMIKLAGEHGYMFDETEFSFVTVRDRIRCYYKSYVQSMKKRGVVIGYAARKAGLVTEEELEQSAHTNGKIFVPRS
mmetsp:Transcript_27795/g.58718  ORF Transcript_27795/g.58718 Transcript_27795/m.58718 type:complete len:397 (+) Transcript_27795:201-1391(+)|eukprot:CAMPEP_0183724646 /NCGR_PEP_ID=MMETSP0737-20130205/18057_1 /TAXON_ID=385413 /ORGANISM="Thalassiosira miniscula, Strain CCMP1093" /LENGTH=396 /DNA_ID=CAMNT_0025955285 /DNA_START=184 /DNA_END=1374 /DNA_ORIENTATION=-